MGTLLLFGSLGVVGTILTAVYAACVAAKTVPRALAEAEDLLTMAALQEKEPYLPVLTYPYLEHLQLDALPLHIERRVLTS